MSKWARLRSLKRSQWSVILLSPFVLSQTWLDLWRHGYRKTLDRINSQSGRSIPREQQTGLAKDTAYALAISFKYGPWKPRCLTRSLTLARLLKRRGVPFVIRIGLPHGMTAGPGTDPEGFSAHAWVEHDGIVLNDRDDVATRHSAFDKGPGST